MVAQETSNRRQKQAPFAQLGASSHTEQARERNDYYATEPKATELLMKLETFNQNILEPMCGEGHISKVLESHGYQVTSCDLINRGYGVGGINFLNDIHTWDGDIISNPPYKNAVVYVKHALDIVPDGSKVAMFLKIQFAESGSRRDFFKQYPPKTIWVSSDRLKCAPNGNFDTIKSSAICFCWFIWEKGYQGESIIKWFN